MNADYGHTGKCPKGCRCTVARMFKNKKQTTWQDDFRSAYGSAFKDKDILESCIGWIEGLDKYKEFKKKFN